MAAFKLMKPSEKNPNQLSWASMVLPVLFYLLCGILLIVLHDIALNVASYVLAGVMLLYAIYLIVVYFDSPVIRRVTEPRLAAAMILLLSGILLAFNPGYMDKLFPVLWGLALLFGSFLKFQFAFDEKALKINRWWLMLVFAGFSLLIGILALLRPGFLGENKETVIGFMLIAEAVLDGIVFFLISRALKKQAPPADLSAAAPAGEQPQSGTEQPV